MRRVEIIKRKEQLAKLKAQIISYIYIYMVMIYTYTYKYIYVCISSASEQYCRKMLLQGIRKLITQRFVLYMNLLLSNRIFE